MKKILLVIFLLVISSTLNFLKADEQPVNTMAGGLGATPTIQPKLVSVQIVNATVGPSKVDGSKWSGFGKVNPSVTAQLGQLLLKTASYASVVGLLSGPAMASVSDKPAPFGWVEVALNGEYIPKLKASLFRSFDKGLERTYTPIFNLPSYQNVPLDEGTRFKITLYSKNRIVPKPAPIGVVVINSKDLQNALAEEKIYQVPVADQTQNQLLFVGIEVSLVTSTNNH